MIWFSNRFKKAHNGFIKMDKTLKFDKSLAREIKFSNTNMKTIRGNLTQENKDFMMDEAKKRKFTDEQIKLVQKIIQ